MVEEVTASAASLKHALYRSLALLGLLTLEYIVIALNFDGLMHRYPGPWEHLTDVITFSVLGVGGVFVLFGRRVLAVLSQTFGRYSTPPPSLRGPLIAHLLAYAAMIGTIVVLAGREWTRLGFGGGVIILMVCGFASMAALMLALLPSVAYRTLFVELRSQLLFGVLAGAVAFAGGFLASLAWESMAGTTLVLTAAVLRWLGVEVEAIPDELVLTAEGFSVLVAKECSGLEGIGLVIVFLGLYLLVSRDRFVFPKALLLLPLGVLAMYVANLLRIVLLVLTGARISPAVALGGFHSKAGWVFFSAVSLSIVAVASRFKPLLKDEAVQSAETGEAPVNDAAVFLMPLLAMIASYLVTSLLLSSAFDPLYGIRVVAVVTVLVIYRHPLLRIPRHVSIYGPLSGVIAFVLWMMLMEPPERSAHLEYAAGLSVLPPVGQAAWLVLRVIGSVITVPIAEELAFRGFLLRTVADRDFMSVPYSKVTWLGLLVSSLAFGALHSAYIAGTAVGLLYGLTMWRRGSLADAIVAHGTTNALLSGYVLVTGEYAYW